MERQRIVVDAVDEEEVRRHAEFAAVVIVAAVARDHGVQLHLQNITHTHTHFIPTVYSRACDMTIPDPDTAIK